MAVTAAAVRPYVWYCDVDAIVCPRGHLFATYRAGFRGRWGRVVGHRFEKCEHCDPPIYFLIVYVTDPSFAATCHAISRESYVEWMKNDDPTPPTLQLLYLLRDPEGKSLNPEWRPKR